MIESPFPDEMEAGDRLRRPGDNGCETFPYLYGTLFY